MSSPTPETPMPSSPPEILSFLDLYSDSDICDPPSTPSGPPRINPVEEDEAAAMQDYLYSDPLPEIRSTNSSPLSLSRSHLSEQETASFLERHVISGSSSPPPGFQGPHTALQIPNGPHWGEFLHFSGELSEEQQNLAVNAMSYIWNPLLKEPAGESSGPAMHSSPGQTSKLAFAHIPRTHWELLGPAQAHFPIDRSVKAPFAGPHTAVQIHGTFFRGFYLHIPRYLTRDEIRLAEENTKTAFDKSWGWGEDLNAVAITTAKYSKEELDENERLYEQQKTTGDFLEFEVGLDLEIQDRGDLSGDGMKPIWFDQNLDLSIELPKLSSRKDEDEWAFVNSRPNRSSPELPLNSPSAGFTLSLSESNSKSSSPRAAGDDRVSGTEELEEPVLEDDRPVSDDGDLIMPSLILNRSDEKDLLEEEISTSKVQAERLCFNSSPTITEFFSDEVRVDFPPKNIGAKESQEVTNFSPAPSPAGSPTLTYHRVSGNESPCEDATTTEELKDVDAATAGHGFIDEEIRPVFTLESAKLRGKIQISDDTKDTAASLKASDNQSGENSLSLVAVDTGSIEPTTLTDTDGNQLGVINISEEGTAARNNNSSNQLLPLPVLWTPKFASTSENAPVRRPGRSKCAIVFVFVLATGTLIGIYHVYSGSRDFFLHAGLRVGNLATISFDSDGLVIRNLTSETDETTTIPIPEGYQYWDHEFLPSFENGSLICRTILRVINTSRTEQLGLALGLYAVFDYTGTGVFWLWTNIIKPPLQGIQYLVWNTTTFRLWYIYACGYHMYLETTSWAASFLFHSALCREAMVNISLTTITWACLYWLTVRYENDRRNGRVRPVVRFIDTILLALSFEILFVAGFCTLFLVGAEVQNTPEVLFTSFSFPVEPDVTSSFALRRDLIERIFQ